MDYQLIGLLKIIKTIKKNFHTYNLFLKKMKSMYDALVKGLQRVNGEVVSYINAGDFYNLNTFSNIKISFRK